MPPAKAAPRAPRVVQTANGHSANGHADVLAAGQAALLTTFREVLMDEGARVLGAVSLGDLSQRIPLEVGGEPLRGDFLGWANVVNAMVANLAEQVRAIATVSTAVTNGDMSQFISVDAYGEIGQLKDNINQMIVKLRDTTQQNTEQDWLKTSLAMVTGRLQGQKDL